jgi:hypothetical protein
MDVPYFTAEECRSMSYDDLLRRLAMWPVYGRATFDVLEAERQRRLSIRSRRRS